MSTPTPVRDLAAVVRQRLETDGPFAGRSFTVRAHRNRNARRILIDWSGIPNEAEVLAPIVDLLVGQDVTVCLNRERMWSCGTFHADSEAAWMAHEGQEHLVFQCGCGAIAAEGDRCDDEDLGPDDIPRYCGEMGEDVLTDSTRAYLTDRGETFQSTCSPGEYVNCPCCGGYGSLINTEAHTSRGCPACNRDCVFDLAAPRDRARYDAALSYAAEAAARAEADRGRRVRPTRSRHLP